MMNSKRERNELLTKIEHMEEYIRDHVCSYIDSDEIEQLLSYDKWCELYPRKIDGNELAHISLTPDQKRYVDAAKWFYKQGNRGHGKSFAVAYTFLRLAIESPNTQIDIYEAIPSARERENIKQMIIEIARGNKNLFKHMIFRETSIEIKLEMAK